MSVPTLDGILDQLAEVVAARVAERLDKRGAEQPEREATQPDFLSEAEIARRTGLSVRTLQSWRHLGRGPTWVRAGTRILYPAKELSDFLHSRPTGSRRAGRPKAKREPTV